MVANVMTKRRSLADDLLELTSSAPTGRWCSGWEGMVRSTSSLATLRYIYLYLVIFLVLMMTSC